MEMIMSTLVKAVLIPTVISASSVAFPRLGAAKTLRLDGGERDAFRSSLGCEKRLPSHLLTPVLPQTTIPY
jgi:hypothetical protein